MSPTQQDLAAALGVHPSVVTRLKARGMPVDSVASAQAWRRANVRVRMNERRPQSGAAGAGAAGSAAVLGGATAAAPGGATAAAPGGGPVAGVAMAGTAVSNAGGRDAEGDGQYWTSRARREAAEATLAELKLAEAQGDLVRAADVRAAQALRLAALREALLQLPSRLSAVMAAEADQGKCHDLLQAELHLVLAHAVGGAA